MKDVTIQITAEGDIRVDLKAVAPKTVDGQALLSAPVVSLGAPSQEQINQALEEVQVFFDASAQAPAPVPGPMAAELNEHFGHSN